MRYPEKHVSLVTGGVTGAQGAVIGPRSTAMHAWLPSTWPEHNAVDAAFIATLKAIFQDSMLFEIRNVVDDAHARNGDLRHRGHVVAVALMCALDAISCYGYRGVGPPEKSVYISKFIKNHFPPDYRPHADAILTLYRHCLIHSWNLFEASLLPGNDNIRLNGTLSFGLLNFLSALETATSDFLVKLATEPALQKNALALYQLLRTRAK